MARALASLRRASLAHALMVIVMLVAALSMGPARAAALDHRSGVTADHCATMAAADEAVSHDAPDVSHPAVKIMNCAMTCAFIVHAAPLFDMPARLSGDKQPARHVRPLHGVGRHLDLPPPKG